MTSHCDIALNHDLKHFPPHDPTKQYLYDIKDKFIHYPLQE